MPPSWDQTAVPGLVALTHFHSSTTSGSASWTSVRILLRVSPRQWATSAILLSISSDAGGRSADADSFMVSSSTREFVLVREVAELAQQRPRLGVDVRDLV